MVSKQSFRNLLGDVVEFKKMNGTTPAWTQTSDVEATFPLECCAGFILRDINVLFTVETEGVFEKCVSIGLYHIVKKKKKNSSAFHISTVDRLRNSSDIFAVRGLISGVSSSAAGA